MSTVAINPAKPAISDFRSLAPWYAAAILHSYALTLFGIACYDFADTHLNAPASMRLWISSFWGFAYIFVAIIAGKLTVKWGARKTLFIMVPACIFAELLLLSIVPIKPGASWGTWLLMLLMLPVNITSTTCWPALETAISRSPAKTPLSTRMALYNICWSSTGFLAIFTRGPLEAAGFSVVFLAPVITTLIALAILYKYAIPESMMSEDHVTAADPDSAHDTPEQIARAKTLLHMAWIGNALAYVAINVILPVLTFLATAAWAQYFKGEPTTSIAAFVTSVWALTRMIGFIITAKSTFWHYKARWLVGSQLALALAFFAMLIVHDPFTLIATQIIFGLTTALIYSSSLYYAMHTSEGSGEHAGFHEALIGIGICLGPAIGAVAGSGASLSHEAQLASLHRAAWAVTIVLVLGTAIMAVLSMRRRPPSVTLSSKGVNQVN